MIGTQQNARSTNALQNCTVAAHLAVGTEQKSGTQVALTRHHQNSEDTTTVPLNRRYLRLGTDVATGTAPHPPHQLLRTCRPPVAPATDVAATGEGTVADGDDITALVTQLLHLSHMLPHCQDKCKTVGVSILTLINSYYPHSHHHCSRPAKNQLSSAKQRNVRSQTSPRGLKLGIGMPPAESPRTQ